MWSLVLDFWAMEATVRFLTLKNKVKMTTSTQTSRICPVWSHQEEHVLLFLSLLFYFVFLKVRRMSRQIHLPAAVAESGIPPLYWCTAHYVEMLLKAEVPLVHSAFRMSGFTPSQVGYSKSRTHQFTWTPTTEAQLKGLLANILILAAFPWFK